MEERKSAIKRSRLPEAAVRFSRRLAYEHVGTFKGLLFVIAVVLSISVLVYTRVIVDQLRESTRRELAQKIRTYSTLIDSDNPELIALALEQIQAVDFPIVVTDSSGRPKQWKNIGISPEDTSSAALERIYQVIKALDTGGNERMPIKVGESQIDWFHYGDSVVIRQIKWLPWLEIAAAALFIIVGYTGFRNIKRSEERMVWVGLAKETAHQLGTPLTSLMGWLELLKSENVSSHSLNEMGRDVERLQQITARFSQIGSEALLVETPLTPVIQDVVDYFNNRLPKTGRPIRISTDYSCLKTVRINTELFGWVMENLIKNSIDALSAAGGEIQVRCREKGDRIFVDVADNGPGIQPKNRRNVFRPGFSTKTRGWGLGLSLGRRIIEDYHGGRLYIKESVPGKGTVMRIALRRTRVGCRT